MGKSFRADDLNQSLLLPPSLHDWLPEGHLARFVLDVVGELDLRAICASYSEKDGRGMSAYAPEMMVQALQMCSKAGLVKLGHVAIDGTKIKANASKHKAMSYERMGETEQRLQQEVDALLQQAEATDAAEDAMFGKDKRGDELPAELARRETRLRKIRQAKAELEQEAMEKAVQQRSEAEAKAEAKLATAQPKQDASVQETDKPCPKQVGSVEQLSVPETVAPEQALPLPKAQRNFTDPESRIMPDSANKGSFLQGYNAQAAVDSGGQIIVAAEITQQTNDSRQLVPMLQQVEANMGRKPDAVSADAGYWSEANATHEAGQGMDLHIATGRSRHDQILPKGSAPPPSETATARQRMQYKLNTEAGHAVYKMRKAIVEPIFGQIKECRGFRRFSMRGLDKVQQEWKLVCATSNLLKLFGSGWKPQTA